MKNSNHLHEKNEVKSKWVGSCVFLLIFSFFLLSLLFLSFCGIFFSDFFVLNQQIWIWFNIRFRAKFLDNIYPYLSFVCRCYDVDRQILFTFLLFTNYSYYKKATIFYNTDDLFPHFSDKHVEHIDTEFTLRDTLSEKEQQYGN